MLDNTQKLTITYKKTKLKDIETGHIVEKDKTQNEQEGERTIEMKHMCNTKPETAVWCTVEEGMVSMNDTSGKKTLRRMTSCKDTWSNDKYQTECHKVHGTLC